MDRGPEVGDPGCGGSASGGGVGAGVRDRASTGAAPTAPPVGSLPAVPQQRDPAPTVTGAPPPSPEPAARAAGPGAGAPAVLGRLGGRQVLRLVPTPRGTPFTFGYAAVLAVTSFLADHARPAFVRALHQASSTDVAHLVRHPVLVLIASALWIVGGIASPYAAGFLLVLTALERRTGPVCAAAVFLVGHVVATLVTELPVGAAVLAGALPVGSTHRLDYGISFGVAASVGALAGLLSPWLRWPLLIGFGSVLTQDLILLADPVTDAGHLIALAIGVATWPLVRRRHHPRPPATHP
ncbi:rhomboid-like protein [Streptomyces sp. NPDC059618]|uniref:rhomboid-like protein n=1 Tax=Streptomyces sp. NPDC059618 TaxID=3346887 RepID=UPI00368F5F26